MGAWIDQNPGVAVTLLLAAISGVVYILRLEGALGALKARVTACENRANEDRKEIKEQLTTIGSNVDDVKETLNQLVGAYGGRRIGDHLLTRLEPGS